MKFAFMTFSTPEWNLERLLRFCETTGFHGVEPRLESSHAHGIESDISSNQRRKIKQLVDNSGIELCCLATSVKILEPGKWSYQRDKIRRSLELAYDVGSPSLRIFGSGEGDPESQEFARANKYQLRDALAELKPYAEESKVKLCLETHDYWTDSRILKKIFEEVGGPYLGVNWDPMHCLRICGISAKDSYIHLQPWIYHAHMHAGRNNSRQKPYFEFLPLNHPDDEFQAYDMQKIAQESGYTGYFSGEWLNQWSDPENELPRELATCLQWEGKIQRQTH